MGSVLKPEMWSRNAALCHLEWKHRWKALPWEGRRKTSVWAIKLKTSLVIFWNTILIYTTRGSLEQLSGHLDYSVQFLLLKQREGLLAWIMHLANVCSFHNASLINTIYARTPHKHTEGSIHCQICLQNHTSMLLTHNTKRNQIK